MKPIPSIVLVIESQPVMCDALCSTILQEVDMKAAMQAGDVQKALHLTGVVIPDIILLAFDDQPDHDNMGDLAMLHKAMPSVPILVLSSNEWPGGTQAVLDAGAQALVVKSASRKELIRVLRTLRAKTLKTYLESRLTKEANGKSMPRSPSKVLKVVKERSHIRATRSQTIKKEKHNEPFV